MSNTMKQKVDMFIIFVFSLLVLGCNTGPATPTGFPKNFLPCELLILQDNQPLDRAFVELFPVGETGRDWSIGGYTNANGVVIPYTYGKWQGVPPNSYKVTVNKQIEKKDISYSLVALPYINQTTTPLELEIKGAVKQTFDVGKAVSEKIPSK
jgi:hypothetical protein